MKKVSPENLDSNMRLSQKTKALVKDQLAYLKQRQHRHMTENDVVRIMVFVFKHFIRSTHDDKIKQIIQEAEKV